MLLYLHSLLHCCIHQVCVFVGVGNEECALLWLAVAESVLSRQPATPRTGKTSNKRATRYGQRSVRSGMQFTIR